MSVLAPLTTLSPANFGMVMATGIIGLAAHDLGMPRLAHALLILNFGIAAVLLSLTLLRAAFHSRRFFGDMVDHQRGPGFFTIVAATSILGSQVVVLVGDYTVGVALWGVALTLWLAMTYTIFTGIFIKEDKPSLVQGLSGSWLLAVVATQSIGVLSGLLATHVAQPHRLQLNFLALSMWLCGGMLYIWTISLIFYRYAFFAFSPSDLSPPYWINMGAMAISTLVGSLLVINAPDAPFLASLLPFIKGFTVLYWATGTWWIPMLLILGLWRYVYRRFPLRYDPLYWGAVFPLGMYSAGTYTMIHAMGFDFLDFLPPVFFYLALTAWGAALGGMAFDLLRIGAPAANATRGHSRDS